MHPVPLSLYIHLPWCIKKCPYCDFNSHTLNGHTHGLLPEQLASTYVAALLADARAQTHWAYGRAIDSVFMVVVRLACYHRHIMPICWPSWLSCIALPAI